MELTVPTKGAFGGYYEVLEGVGKVYHQNLLDTVDGQDSSKKKKKNVIRCLVATG